MGQEPEPPPSAQALGSLSLARWTSALSVLGLVGVAIGAWRAVKALNAIMNTAQAFEEYDRLLGRVWGTAALVLIGSALAGCWYPYPPLRSAHRVVTGLCAAASGLGFGLSWLTMGASAYIAEALLCSAAAFYAVVPLRCAVDAWIGRYRRGLTYGGPWALGGCVLCLGTALLLDKWLALGWAKAID